jgi:hypothetical protein
MNEPTKADYERQLKRAIDWLRACGPQLSEEKSSEFQRRYCDLVNRAVADFPDIQPPCIEFGPDLQLRVSRWSWTQYTPVSSVGGFDG